jgi:hypothetical protein
MAKLRQDPHFQLAQDIITPYLRELHTALLAATTYRELEEERRRQERLKWRLADQYIEYIDPIDYLSHGRLVMIGEGDEVNWFTSIDDVHRNNHVTNNLLLYCHPRAFGHLIQGPAVPPPRIPSPVAEPSFEDELAISLNHSYLANSPIPVINPMILTPAEHARFEQQLQEWDGPSSVRPDLSRISREWDQNYPDMAWRSFRSQKK